MSKCCVSGEEITILAASIAVSLSKGCSDDELDLLGNLFQAVGTNLCLIGSGRNACSSSDADDDESCL